MIKNTDDVNETVKFMLSLFFKINILKDISLFCGATSGDIYPGFQSQGGSPCLCALSPLCNGLLRFNPRTYTHTSIGLARVWDGARYPKLDD